MFKKRCVFVLVLLIFTITALSTVSASDLNTTDEVIGEEVTIDAELEQTEDVILEASGNTFTDLYKEISSSGSTVTLDRDYYYNYYNDRDFLQGIEIEQTEDVILEASGNTFTDLYNKISSSGSTVTLDRDYYYNYYNDRDFLQGIEINGVLTINGNGHTIYANGVRTFIFEENAEVIIDGVNFVNNNNGIWIGGGTIVNLGKLTLKNCEFINSSAGGGGAVLSLNKLIIYSCRFTHNRVYDDDVLSIGGAISARGSLLIYDSYFTQNGAEYSGGAISSECGSSNVVNCSFVNNSAENGGAIDNKNNMSIYSSSFINNSASNKGGSIINEGNMCIYSSSFIDNSAGYDGGAIYSDDSIRVYSCDFSRNCVNWTGAGIFSKGACYVVDSNFIDNSAEHAGAIYSRNESIIEDSNFVNNFVGTNGGSIINEGNMSIYSSSFINNSAENAGTIFNIGNISVYSCEFTKNCANGSCGVIYSDGACYVVNSDFVENTAMFSGAIFSKTEGFIVNSSFVNNSASEYGGAIDSYDDMSIYSSSFIDNTAGNDGGAVYGWGAFVVDCSFIDNAAGGNGGAMYGASAVNCSFIDNAAGGNGGAMYGGSAYSSSFTDNHATTDGGAGYDVFAANCLFEYNSAENGGAMSKGKATDCIFNYNNATSYGGAVYGAIVSTSSKFKKNYAPNGKNTYDVTWFDKKNTKSFMDLNELINNNNDMDIYLKDNYTFDLTTDLSFKDGINISRVVTIHGNGFTIDGDNTASIFSVSNTCVVFRDIVFMNGKSQRGGGAIYCSGSSTVVNCSFIDNSAFDGGAIYSEGESFDVVNCSFIDNSAINDGGAVFVNDGEFKAMHTKFISNSASGLGLHFGGAMYGGYAEDCIFADNVVGQWGGAMYEGSAVNCTFVNNYAESGSAGAMGNGSAVNCIFINNSAGDYCGGALDNVFALSCRFINNHARSGGAMYEGSAVNCSFINNSAEYGGAIAGGSAVNCSFISNSAEWGGASYNGASVNCSFISNSADFGGAIYAYEAISVVNCSFTENSASSHGGAALHGSFINCIFTRNSAYRGGAIAYYDLIIDCTFIENSANVGGAVDFQFNEGTILNSNFTRNSALWEAGAVYSVHCVNCSFTENYADYGGAMKDASANNCIFTGNYAVFGGASYNSTSVNCSFIENYADYGGAIYEGLHSENCSFIKNFADFGGAMYGNAHTADTCRFINNTARYGGATYQIIAENCYFKDNEATENGGAMYGESATNCIFENNVAKCSGNDTYNTVIPDSSYDNNIIYFDASATEDGDGSENNPYKYLYPSRITPGVIAYFAEGTYYLNGTCIITGAKLIGKSRNAIIKSQIGNQYDFIVKKNSYLELYSIRFINANILNQGTLIARETLFEGNDVFDLKNLPDIESGSGLFDSSYGGVIVCDAPSNIRPTLILDFCGFDDVYGAFNGGVIAAINSEISISNTGFMSYSATYKGGAIYCVNSNVNIFNSEFTLFTISSDTDSTVGRYDDYNSYYGGSIYCENCDMFIHQSKFEGSVSFSFGGCIASLNSYISIEGTIFNNSLSLTDGGGVVYNSKSKLFIHNSIFEGNCAEFGGAICNINSILDSYYAAFRNNSANYYGGVVYDIYGTLDFFENQFYGSHALVGGSIYARITNSFNSYYNNFTGSFAQEGAVIFFDGKKEELGSYFNSFGNNYHLFVEFRATLNGRDYYLISNPLFYQLSSKADSDLYLPYSIFEVDDGLVSIVIYDRDDASNLTSIATSNVIRNVSAKIRFSEKFVNPTLNFYLLEGINRAVFTDRDGDTKVYSHSRNELFKGYNLIKTYSIDLSDKVINNDYNLTESCAIDFSIRSGNLYEDNSYYPVSLINSSFTDAYSTLSGIGVVPSYYNSNDYGLVSSVKDQKNGGNCWAFAGLATLEACLKKATGVTYDFSEENAKNLMAAYSVYGVKIETNYAGYDSMIMSYLASWLGPIDESKESYDDYSSISILEKPMFHIQNIKFLPARLNSNDNDLYKLAIMDYGAVSVIFKWGKDYHAVSLVGWDDDYKGYDSIGNKANGAWIFKNSFGEDWENGGFGYLSYNQKISEQIDPSLHAYTFVFSDANPYEKIYQYDFAGVSQFYHYKGSIYFKNTFEAESDSLLSAFSTYFDTQTDYTVSVYVNDQFVFTQNGTSAAGYYTIPFNNFIQLDKGDKFTIMVHNHNKDDYSCIPLCYAEEITKKTFSANVSFVSLDGETWYDLYGYADSCHVACIKAFTQNINLRNIKINANKIKTVNTRNFNVKVSFDDFERISSINYCLLKFIVDGKNYYAQIKDGTACLNLNLEDGRHTLSAQYKDNVFESNVIQFSFTVDTSRESNSFNSLQDIVDSASDKSTIFLDRDYVYDEYLDDGDYGVFIDKPITINGNGHLIDGLNKATGFYVAFDNVVLNDIVFMNTFAVNGGGVFIAGRNVTLNNCIFINSKATQSGGAIYSLFDINLNNCQFINDSANMGGGLYLISTETSHIENSCFDNNSAIAHGSAIYMAGVGDVLILSSNFTSNVASYNGGAIFSGIYSNKFSDCNFIDNFANCGGAVFSNARFNEFINCNFVNNTATVSSGAINAHNNINIHNSDFINNSVVGKNSSSSNLLGGYGGGAITSYDNLNIYDSNFINNHVSTSGGAIYTNKYLNIYKSNFINNSASGGGGAIYNNPYDKYLISNSFIYNSTFIDNFAICGGAIYSGNQEDSTSNINISSSKFINNHADDGGGVLYLMDNGLIIDSIFVENNANWGGAIINFGNISIDTCNFTKNHVVNGGGSIYSQGTCYVRDSYFDDNAANTGGAIFLEIEGFIANSRFVNNYAFFAGGAVDSLGECSLSDSDFVENHATYGGAILLEIEGFIANSRFVNNYASFAGGAVGSVGECSLFDSDFVENHAKYGGAICSYYRSDSTPDINISSCRFINNYANASGGAVYTDGKGIVGNSLFAENNATYGGAIINLGNANFNTCNFSKNYAISKGGAMYGGNASNCTFISNSASYGGAISNGYAVCCYFQNNTARSDGDDTYETEVITPILSVRDFTSNYNSGDKLITDLINPGGALINDANVAIGIYKKGKLLNTYYCLSGEGWVVDLVPGNYVAVVSANPGYLIDPVNATIKINKADTSLLATANNTELVATLTYSTTGKAIKGANIVIRINGEDYSLKTDSKGQVKIFTASSEYTAVVSYAGNTKFNPSNTCINHTSKIDMIISAVYNTGNKEIVATLTNGVTGKPVSNANVKVNLNGKTTTVKTNNKGHAIISTADLPDGSYTATFSYKGNSKYKPASTSFDFNTKADMIISAVYDFANKQIVATLTNGATGKPVTNANVKVNLNGESTTVKTNNKGQAIISTANLSDDSYIATISYNGNSKYNPASTGISFDVKTKVIITDVYGYQDKLVATLTNGATGNPIVNAYMQVKINGMTYTAKSNSKSQISIDTSDLGLTEYDVTISYGGNSRYTPSSTTTKINLNKANMNIKYSYNADTKELVATLKNSKTGKVISNANMVVDINGVRTTLKSNNKGQIVFSTADFAPGTHVGTITYGGNDRYNSISAAFKVDV